MPAEDLRTKSLLPELLATRRRLRHANHSLPTVGRRQTPGPLHEEQATGAGKTGTLRAAIFGVNDGLVSNAALIMGFAGADQSRTVIMLAGISGLLAGAFSMAAGEYVSMRVQREVLERMLHLEAHELANDPRGRNSPSSWRSTSARAYRPSSPARSPPSSRRTLPPRSTPTPGKSSASIPTRGWVRRGGRPSRRSSRSPWARWCRWCRSCSWQAAPA